MLPFKNFLGLDEQVLEGISAERNTFLIKNEFEDFLRARIVEIEKRVKESWKYDYSSIKNYMKSIEKNRRELRNTLRVWGGDLDPLKPTYYSYFENEKILAKWVILPFKENLRCHGAIAFPKNKKGKLPVVIAQHGIDSTPEHVFGLRNPEGVYHSYGMRLAEEGFVVLAPVNLVGAKPRARIERLSLLLGTTLPGLEVRKYERWIDFLQSLPEVDGERIGMWGLSLGGFYTLFTLPIELRIKAGIISAFFNHRIKKMVIDDPRYSCFLSTEEEHIFVPGWLSEFRDREVVSLICPRPVQVQSGKTDGIAWYPFVEEEFNMSKVHYKKLGIKDRIELVLHEGGHEVKVEQGIRFMKKWI